MQFLVDFNGSSELVSYANVMKREPSFTGKFTYSVEKSTLDFGKKPLRMRIRKMVIKKGQNEPLFSKEL